MQQQDNHIDWDKLIELLEKPSAEQGALVAALSGEEQKLFAQLQQVKEDSLLTSALQLDTVRAWKKVSYTPVKLAARRWIKWVAAACLLLLAGAGWLLWQQLHKAPVVYQSITEGLADHIPADKVKLVTADGHMIEIDSARQLKEKDGTLIQLQQGAIDYHNSAVATTQGKDLLMNTLMVPRGYMYHLTLSDGSKVWLNAGSKISFPVHFDSQERKVAIDGEAYFEVVHNAKWPFIVSVHNTEVKVLGTSFDVKAYGKNIYTTLVTGSVLFTLHAAKAAQLTPDQQVVYTGGDVIETRKVIAGDWIAWKDDDLVMIKMSMAELAEVLERRYDVQISFTDEKLKDIQYNGALHLTGNIIDMLSNLEQTGNIHFAVKDKKILILPAVMK